MNGEDDTPIPKRKRRWWRYSLRTFLLLVTAFAVWLGLLVHRVHKQKAAVQWVNDNGGWVAYDFQFNEEVFPPLNREAKPPGPDWLRELIGVDYFSEVRVVDLTDTEVSDLRPLRDLPHLRLLSVERTPVSDIEPLSELPELQWLILAGTKVSDLGPLVGMNKVRIDLDNEQPVTIPPELEDQVNRWPPGY